MGEKGRSSSGARRAQVRVIRNSSLHHMSGPSGPSGLRSHSSSPTKASIQLEASLDTLGGGAKRGKRVTDIPTLALCASPPPRLAAPAASPKNLSARSSPSLGYHYAGAKFSEPPSPDSLPKPPTHWNLAPEGQDRFLEISKQLKMMLNVQA